MTASAPVLALSALVDAVSARRGPTTRVVLANGAFDLLHVGHLRYLTAAAALGDLLVVAINTDASVRQAKGCSRPIIPEGQRAELVAALRCVDYVTLFDSPTVAPVIEALRPNLQAKGTDYTPESVAEAPLMRRLGGAVVIVGGPKDFATSAIVRALTPISPTVPALFPSSPHAENPQ